jgi:hypothetical protein
VSTRRAATGLAQSTITLPHIDSRVSLTIPPKEDTAQRLDIEVHLAIQPGTAELEELVRRAEESHGGVAIRMVDDETQHMGEVREGKRTWPDGGLGVSARPHRLG